MYTSRWERVVGDILLDCREMFDTGTSSLGNILQDYNLSNYNTTCRALQPFSAFGLMCDLFMPSFARIKASPCLTV